MLLLKSLYGYPKRRYHRRGYEWSNRYYVLEVRSDFCGIKKADFTFEEDYPLSMTFIVSAFRIALPPWQLLNITHVSFAIFAEVCT